MCGIIGIASNRPILDRDWLTSSRDEMSYRGPDDFGVWWSKESNVGLAHRRLSIIDLSKAGHQPMINKNGDLTIVFNGEIYNYKELRDILIKKGISFFSDSDTEVILAAYEYWGFDCIDYFRGMFSFAIYDLKKRSIFLARDRLGEKPLYYSTSGNEFIFSSEIKTLMSYSNASKMIDSKALNFYLSMGYIPHDMTMISDIKKLPPAHAMSFDIDKMRHQSWRYWKVPVAQEFSMSNIEAYKENLTEELELLLEDSVKKQLRSDVPIGVLLSGGVDSSLITAIASKHIDNLKTFTISFSGNPKYDESHHARLVAKYFKTDHIELDAGQVSPDFMIDLASKFDDPVIDSSIIPTYMVTNLVSEHCKVVLGGDGGDELFGGYKHYSRLSLLKKRLSFIPNYFLRGVSEFSDNYIPIGTRGRNWLRSTDSDFHRGLPQVATFFDPVSRKRLLRNGLFSDLPEQYFKENVYESGNLIDKATRMDVAHFLPEDILVKVDRTSMLNSLEVRAPFLDHHLVEFAFSKVPTTLKADHYRRKILLKNLTKKLLPEKFDRSRKQGFEVPLNTWLKDSEWRDIFADIIYQSNAFENKIIDDLFVGIDKGRNNGERIFGLAFLELWRRKNNLSF